MSHTLRAYTLGLGQRGQGIHFGLPRVGVSIKGRRGIQLKPPYCQNEQLYPRTEERDNSKEKTPPQVLAFYFYPDLSPSSYEIL